MHRYRKLRILRDNIVFLPGLSSYKDFDISVEIGHYEFLGTPLSLKQLLLLEIAAEATVRRHLNSLIERGLVTKVSNPDDGRAVVLKLTNEAHQIFDDALKNLHKLLEELC